MGYVAGIVFFILAGIFYRQHKEVDRLKYENIDLKVKLDFARNEVYFARTKYAELSQLAEEQIDRADAAEAKLKELEEKQ